MAGNEQEQDRSEPATPYKLSEARKRGQVAKSMEMASCFTLAAAIAFGWMLLDGLVAGQLNLSAAFFDQAGHVQLSLRSVQSLFAATVWRLLAVFGLFVALIAGAGILGSFAQTGPIFSWHPLKPDFSRVNPAAGFKRVFNARILYEAVKCALKLALITAVVYACLVKALPALMALLLMDVHAHPAWLSKQMLHLVCALLALLVFIAALDFGYVKWDFGKRMRMSRREVREEVKRRDGDPKIKAKIRELQREAARRGASLKRVPDADVLIVNPTHISIAVKYERGKSLAPVVIAKGSGELALQMRVKASHCRIPITENRPLAQALFRKVPLNGAVLPETYAAVAQILKWAYRRRQAAHA
jgi:flagellar biosynthetic protein FlhB